jgi:hypothetical protein
MVTSMLKERIYSHLEIIFSSSSILFLKGSFWKEYTYLENDLFFDVVAF